MADPTNVFALDDVAFMTNLQILPVVAPRRPSGKAIERAYERPTRPVDDRHDVGDRPATAGNVEVVEATSKPAPRSTSSS